MNHSGIPSCSRRRRALGPSSGAKRDGLGTPARARPERHRTVCSAIVALVAGLAAVAGHAVQQPAGEPGHASDATMPQEEIPLAVQVFFQPLPEKMPGSKTDTPEMIALGRKLYFERNISLTKTQSCNDCHRLDEQRAGVDNLPTSPGAKGVAGTRNSPTVLNAGFHKVQFWDGRAADLVEQAKGPMLNPIEMGMPTEQDVVGRLAGDPNYPQAFKSAFPNEAQPITFDNVARAIAAFERTLITPSRFDRYLKGQTDALTPEEKRGLQRFVDVRCTDCHNFIPVGGYLLKKLGVYQPYENQSDTGRYEVTHQEQDRFVFKVSALRNVTRTAPYFHDGRVKSLDEAVRLMARMELNVELSDAEVAEIICFLRTLDGEHPLKDGPQSLSIAEQ